MLARVFSCAVIGLEGVLVEVEVDHRSGLPKTVVVGLPDAAVQESRERVHAAVKNSGFLFPRHHVTVNLAPATVHKAGPVYDLPIALAVLICTEQIPHDSLKDSVVLGELSLDGVVRHVRGVLSMAALAREQGIKRIYVPDEDAAEAGLIPDLEILPVSSLRQLADHVLGNNPITPYERVKLEDEEELNGVTDLREVKGQEQVKRALEIAAAGGHNMLMVWTKDSCRFCAEYPPPSSIATRCPAIV